MYTAAEQLGVLTADSFWELVRQHRPWFTPKAAATYLHVSIRTLESWRAVGRGPAYNGKGKYIRYNIADLDGFMQQRIK